MSLIMALAEEVNRGMKYMNFDSIYFNRVYKCNKFYKNPYRRASTRIKKIGPKNS